MYKIVKDKNNIIQDSIDNVVIDPELKEKLNGVGSFTYSIPFDDKYYKDYQEMKSIVDVIGENESNPEFVGRLISIKKKFNGNKELTFEGELAYLNDVQYPPFSFSGSPEELFTSVLDYYNSKCSESNKILKGNVTVTDVNDYIVRENQDYSSCWTVISEKLIKSLGGYIKLRYLNGKRYLDYLLDSGNVSNQNIEFGKNLLDLEDYIDASQIATVIIPLGKKDESTGQRVTIESVNDGKNYIESSLASKYGRIEKVVIWDDVTLPENLLKKANKEIGNIILANKTITTKAIDLHFSNDVIDSFKIGNIINCISIPHDLNVQMILTERTRKLNDPANDTITLGTEKKTLTDSITDTATKTAENESKITGNWLQKVIEDNTKTLLGGSGGYIYVHYLDDNKKHPDSIYIMDCESTSEAKNILLINKNGIGFSTNGVDGPFTSAWTIDGKFNAEFIQAGAIDVNQLKSNVGEELDLSSNKSINYLVKDLTTKVENLSPISTDTTYQLSDSGTDIPTGTWLINVPEPVQGKYLWTKKVVTYENGRTNTSYDISYLGKDGQDGTSVTVKNTSVMYATSNDIADIPNEWSNERPTDIDQGQYLWTKTTVTYSDGKSTTTYSWNYQGVDGSSVDISSQTVEYQVSDDGTKAPAGTWLSDIPNCPSGKYLWTRNITMYSNGLISTSYSVSYHGLNGDKGEDGTGISSITEEYYLSTSKTSQTGGSWTTTPPTWSSGKYLWTRSKIVYTNPSSTVYTTPICDSSWEAVNEIEIGGRNLLSRKQSNMSAWVNLKSSWVTITSDDYNSTVTYNTLGSGWEVIYLEITNLEVNKEYTIGFDYTVPVEYTYYSSYKYGVYIKDSTPSAAAPSGVLYKYIIPKTVTPKTRGTITFKATASTMYVVINGGEINDGQTGIYFEFGKWKLERGNKATDWTPAPEDLENIITSDTAPTDTSKMWFDTTSNLLKYWNGESWEVTNDYADDLNNTRVEITNEYNSAIEQLKSSITSLVEELQTTTSDNSQAVSRLATQIQQNATSISQVITETNSIVDKLSGLSTKEEISKWARFYGEGTDAVLELGASNSPFAVKLSNTELGFYQNGTRIAYLSNQQLNISQAVVLSKLKFSHFEMNDVEIDGYFHLILK